ncbi:MAG: hypothetical protein EZS28_011977 [Streblomastix strix]|uniref:Uncharacterized protein n=1 Tax=Streblomastix strix TaxID=222440 RepID=A0A5J4WDH7_9EUKA|nr:MAG: hypothetical protein EZS28_011977 [Streblomastix strix]
MFSDRPAEEAQQAIGIAQPVPHHIPPESGTPLIGQIVAQPQQQRISPEGSPIPTSHYTATPPAARQLINERSPEFQTPLVLIQPHVDNKPSYTASARNSQLNFIGIDPSHSFSPPARLQPPQPHSSLSGPLAIVQSPVSLEMRYATISPSEQLAQHNQQQQLQQQQQIQQQQQYQSQSMYYGQSPAVRFNEGNLPLQSSPLFQSFSSFNESVIDDRNGLHLQNYDENVDISQQDQDIDADNEQQQQEQEQELEQQRQQQGYNKNHDHDQEDHHSQKFILNPEYDRVHNNWNQEQYCEQFDIWM